MADWHARVKEALERTDILALSTIDEEGCWTSPVQYRYNGALELFFLSMMNTRHVANLVRDPRVSAAIYKPEPFPDGGNLGLQITGLASDVTDHERGDEWHEFKITPRDVWCFDSRVTHQRQKIDLRKFRL